MTNELVFAIDHEGGVYAACRTDEKKAADEFVRENRRKAKLFSVAKHGTPDDLVKRFDEYIPSAERIIIRSAP